MSELKRELEMLAETAGKNFIPETLAMGPAGTLPSGTVVADLAPSPAGETARESPRARSTTTLGISSGFRNRLTART